MKSLTKSELDSLLAVAGSHSAADRLMLLVAFNHGLRVSEVLTLSKDNIVDGSLIVSRLKGSKKTTQVMLDSERAALENLAATVEGPFFPICRMTAHRRIKAYAKEAGIPSFKASMHKLKHTCAVIGLKGNMTLPEVQTWLGHRSLASTGMYLLVDEDVAGRAFAAAVGR